MHSQVGRAFQATAKAVLQSELKKAIQVVFPGGSLPEPLDMVFKYWEKEAW